MRVGDITLPTDLREIRQREKMRLTISMLGITYENMLSATTKPNLNVMLLALHLHEHLRLREVCL